MIHPPATTNANNNTCKIAPPDATKQISSLAQASNDVQASLPGRFCHVPHQTICSCHLTAAAAAAAASAETTPLRPANVEATSPISA